MDKVLQGKVALVTGGAKNIGRRYCQALAEAGAKVVVADIDAAAAETAVAELRQQGAEAMMVITDVANEASVEAMAQQIAHRWGRCDIVVNNAALFVTLPQTLFWDIPANEWDKVLAINVKGVALVTKALLPMMKAQGSGKVINISSGTALKGRPTRMHYVASKGAVIAMTRVMAHELGEWNITVNCIAPGQTVTDSYKEMESEAYFQKALGDRCLKRLETADDLVGPLLFLASPASDFMTGQTVVVDGGSAMV